MTVEPAGKQTIPKSKRVIEYNTIDKSVFTEIQKVETVGSYGTKIEMLVRHLLYLQEVDPGCKSIVFSAWADSLFSASRPILRVDGANLCFKFSSVRCRVTVSAASGSIREKEKRTLLRPLRMTPKCSSCCFMGTLKFLMTWP